MTLRAALLSLLLALLLVSCGGDPPAEGGPRRLRIAYLPIADCAHLYVATEQKLWEKHGLAAEETPLAGGSKALEALAAGSVDVGFASVVTLLQARASGLPFVAVGASIVEDRERAAHQLLVPPSSALAGPADLAGKRLALPTLRGVDQLVAIEYMAQAGLAADAAQLREVPFPRMEGVLQSGEVDAAIAMEPYVSLAVKNGTARAAGNPYTAVADRTLVSTYVMRAGDAAAPAVAAVFADATAWIDAHEAETRALIAARTGLDPALVSGMALNRLEGAPRLADVEAIRERVARAGLVADPPPAADLLPKP